MEQTVAERRGSVLDGRRAPHLVGIRGSGMSGIARILAAGGLAVTGSDQGAAPPACPLAAAGIPVATGHAAEHLPAGSDLVVASAAIPESNPELAAARERGVPVIKYADALGALMARYRGLAVAGAHGKTTTTGMLAFALDRLGASPSFICGGPVPELGGSSRVGGSDLLVVEACEYDRSFHRLTPEVAIITNVDEDHLDYYSGLAEIKEAFRGFARLLPAHGKLVTVNEHARTFARDDRILAALETVGIGRDADWTAREVSGDQTGMRFRLFRGDRDLGPARIRLVGHHNVLAALMVTAVCAHLGHDPAAAAAALAGFPGVSRRFDLKFSRGDVVVLDDYAHHPAEIRCCLSAIRAAWPGFRVWCVFQPHQGSRTRFLLREFAAALSAADVVLVPEIFFARDSEEEKRRISSRDLVMKVRNLGTAAEFVPDFDDLEQRVLAGLRPRDVVVTMGAGNIHLVAESVARRLRGWRDRSIPA